MVAETRYLPYGEERWTGGGAQPTDFTFTGQRADSYIKLIEMGARWYDPQIGRWISPDTIIPDPTNPQSLNRYSYVYNRPLVYIDEEGHIPVIPVLLVLGGAALLCTASNPLPPEQQPPDWQGPLGLTLLFGGGAAAAVPELVGAGATGACADGNCTNEAETVAKALCADGSCANEAEAAARTTRSVWEMAPLQRGVEVERIVGRSPDLVQNFPTIDRFENGVATSIKSLDLTARSYQNIPKLARTVTGYINEMAVYQGQPSPWGSTTILPNQISSRAVDLVIPATGATPEQLQVLQNLQQYASGLENPVVLNIITMQ